jgi:DNA-binding beta-propeller fold protein YncE
MIMFGLFALPGVACLLIAGCGTSPDTPAPENLLARTGYLETWPEPPAPPQVGYMFSFSSARELGMKDSGWSRFLQLLTGPGKSRVKFSKPFSVAFDEAGNLCMTDSGSASVWFFDIEKKSFEVWQEVGPYRITSPTSIARSGGIFYLADSAIGSVLAFRSGKKLLKEFKEGLGRPSGVAVFGDRVYISDTEKHKIHTYNLNGELIHSMGGRGTDPGKFNFPTHLTVDTKGRLYVTDALNARVQVFDQEGNYLRSIGSAGDSSGHFGRPKAVAVDDNGRVYVPDALFDNFQIFDEEGLYLFGIGAQGSGPGEFWMPSGVATGPDNLIVIADSYNKRIQVFQYIHDKDTLE